MSSRFLSSNTLMEGIEGVGFEGPSATSQRKRELQEQIQARCMTFGDT